jgi:hypothetical protein
MLAPGTSIELHCTSVQRSAEKNAQAPGKRLPLGMPYPFVEAASMRRQNNDVARRRANAEYDFSATTAKGLSQRHRGIRRSYCLLSGICQLRGGGTDTDRG